MTQDHREPRDIKHFQTVDSIIRLRRSVSVEQPTMTTQEVVIGVELSGMKAHGIFNPGKQDLRSLNPLLVLIHGGGTNATYFDNRFHS